MATLTDERAKDFKKWASERKATFTELKELIKDCKKIDELPRGVTTLFMRGNLYNIYYKKLIGYIVLKDDGIKLLDTYLYDSSNGYL